MKYNNKRTGVFRSLLEKRVSEILLEEGVAYEYEPRKITLLPSFTWDSKTIRSITYTPDFTDPKVAKWIIEVKGLETPDFKIKWKLLKKQLLDCESPIKLYLVKTLTEARIIAREIKSGQDKNVLRKSKNK